MADHFKLLITRRGVNITTYHNVSENFAQEYHELLTGMAAEKVESGFAYDDYETMSPALQTVLGVDFIGPLPAPSVPNDTNKKSNIQNSEKNKSKYAVYNYTKTLKKRARRLRNDILLNFKVPNVQFVTLTFDSNTFSNADDLSTCHKAFHLFIQRMKYIFSDFIYVATYSKQKNGNWHYHMLCNLDMNIKNKLIQDKWSYGMTHSTPLTKHSELSSRISYCINNMSEYAWENKRGQKGYLHSIKLIQAVELHSWKEDEQDSAYYYLAQIINSDDRPFDISSHETTDEATDNTITISHKYSSKSFPELFQDYKVAKLKSDRYIQTNNSKHKQKKVKK